MSLLSPSESLNFQSFLSSIATSPDASVPGWPMYTIDDGIPDDLEIPHTHGREALAKATKDLMSLDSRWSPQRQQPEMAHHSQTSPQQQSPYDMHFQRQRQDSYNREVFPFLNKQNQRQHQQQHQQPQQQQQIPPNHQSLRLSVAPVQSRNMNNIDHSSQLSPSNSKHPYLPTSPTFQLPSSAQPTQSGYQPSTSATSPPTIPNLPTPTSVPSPRSAAPQFDPAQASSSYTNGKRVSEQNGFINKRARPAPSQDQSTPRINNGSSNYPNLSQPRSQPHPSLQKPALLSPSQKKANHIQSEQKRRANIRRGYEALCMAVPALREAIREEEEARLASAPGGSKSLANADGTKKRGKKGKGLATPTLDSEDKMDGRAGPRSENVVLSKTIDYINDLLADRESLLARLKVAQASLPPEQRHNVSNDGEIPLWEREWKGGEARDDDDEGEDGDE